MTRILSFWTLISFLYRLIVDDKSDVFSVIYTKTQLHEIFYWYTIIESDDVVSTFIGKENLTSIFIFIFTDILFTRPLFFQQIQSQCVWMVFILPPFVLYAVARFSSNFLPNSPNAYQIYHFYSMYVWMEKWKTYTFADHCVCHTRKYI